MGASVFAVKRGGTVVTCAATSGYMVEFDNRHFWMKLKNMIGSHFANYAESYAANKLLDQGRIQPLLTETYDLAHVGDASLAVHHNEAEGKLGVLCLAPSEGLGIDDPEKRERIGEDKITVFRSYPPTVLDPPARPNRSRSRCARRRSGACGALGGAFSGTLSR